MWKKIDAEIAAKSTQFLKILSLIKENQPTESFSNLKESKIVTAEESVNNLMQMFGDKLPQSAKLLYRASENSFKADKFHEKCDNIPHTLTLCETVHGKVIGGYTPLVWDKAKHGETQKDDSGSSFIFSLSNNHKFILDKSKDAIQQHSGTGPCFGDGGNDFFINSSADTHSSYAKINQSYLNENYTAGDWESYMKFTGNPDKTFNYHAQEWEVWGLEFEE
jgi:hypothetical protein